MGVVQMPRIALRFDRISNSRDAERTTREQRILRLPGGSCRRKRVHVTGHAGQAVLQGGPILVRIGTLGFTLKLARPTLGALLQERFDAETAFETFQFSVFHI